MEKNKLNEAIFMASTGGQNQAFTDMSRKAENESFVNEWVKSLGFNKMKESDTPEEKHTLLVHLNILVDDTNTPAEDMAKKLLKDGAFTEQNISLAEYN
mgnify:CR=1 FL=1